MLRKLMWIFVVVLILLVATSAVFAQGGPGHGGHHGNGPDGTPALGSGMGNGGMMGGMMGNSGMMGNGNMMQDCMGMMNGAMHGMMQGMMQGGMMGGNGMMNGNQFTAEPVTSAEDALLLVDDALLNTDYIAGEVIELTSFYYVPVYEGDTALFELWINKETGFIRGINQGRNGVRLHASNPVTLTVDDAIAAANDNLDEGQELGDAIVFPGHYTFTVLQDGAVVGLFKVSGHSGRVMQYQ